MTARPPIPKPPYTGGCLCRAVRYELFARPLAVNACHCNDCKKTSPDSDETSSAVILRPRKSADCFRRSRWIENYFKEKPGTAPGFLFMRIFAAY